MHARHGLAAPSLVATILAHLGRGA
jgi:hypothetical protein